jgi:hydrogenase nickel incorporation protein HypA/HybF
VDLEIGALSGVQIDALQFALDALKPPTMLSGAEFAFSTPLLLLYCRGCENEYVAEIDDLVCPGCLRSDFEIRKGNEIRISTIQGIKHPDEENSDEDAKGSWAGKWK